MATNDDTFADFKLYHYKPSFVAAVVFIALFGITTIYHLGKLFRVRTWYFIPFVIGGGFETVGYVGRALSARQEVDKWTVPPYVMQSLLILLAPALFAASIYMILARIIILTDGNTHSIIRVNWVTKIFVAGDVLSFLTQSTGGGMLAKAKSKKDVDLGEHVIVAGLCIQVIVFGFFIIVAGIFNLRMRRVPTSAALSVTVPWQRHLFNLYGASALIMIRSVFRVIEYVWGADGPLLQHEYYLYIFDAALMWIVTVEFIVWHPSNIISGRKRKHSRDPESMDSGYPLEENQHVHHSLQK